jgi:hypothetical protein
MRRQRLREMVPLADGTIYEIEHRGEFPRRFALAALCRLGSGGGRGLAGLAPINPDSARNRLMSGSGGRALFVSRVGLKQRHRERDEHLDTLLAPTHR